MIAEILHNVDHRPWNLPIGKWSYYQEWNDAVFFHWKVDIDELRKFVPSQLEIDTFEGAAWISLVAFRMEHVRPRGLPSFSPISNFLEINLRTYVKSENKGGVYFLSIEGAKKLSCLLAKSFSGLPYRYSEIARSKSGYSSKNLQIGDSLNVSFNVEKMLEKEEIDRWLTERYALFHDSKDTIFKYEIHHSEWSIQKVNLNNLDIRYHRFEKLIGGDCDRLHYSPGVQVLAWNKEKI